MQVNSKLKTKKSLQIVFGEVQSDEIVDNKGELTMICCNNISNISGWKRFGLQV